MSGPLSGARIVLANNFPGPGMGGGEVQLLSIVEAWLAEGADVVAVVVPGSRFGCEVVKLGGRIAETPMSIRHAAAASKAIAAAAEGAGRPVLVGSGYFTNLLVRLARVRAHAESLVVNIVSTTPGTSRRQGGSRAGAFARHLADRATARPVDAYIAVADSVAAALVAGGAPADRVHAVHNGVDAAALRRQADHDLPPGTPHHRPLVVCVARLEPVKGVEDFVRAAALVPDAQFALAGDGPLHARVREIAVAHRVASRVAFLGRVSPAAALIAAADVVVLPSLSEGLPLVALEAMALGRPVVATAVGGTPEAVVDGITGLLVAPEDPTALAAAIRVVLDDPERAAEMGGAGRERFDAEFSSARMAAGYVRVISDLLAGE